MRIFVRPLLMLLLLLGGSPGTNALAGQRPVVEARLDTTQIRIGEQIKLDLSVVADADARVQFPVIGDTLPGLEVVRRDPQDTLRAQDDAQVTYRQRLYLTRFDTGFVVLEPFQFVVADPSTGSIDSLSTEAQLISVRTLDVDTTQGFKDIKPILDVPFTWRDALPYVGLALALAFAIFLIYQYLKRRKRKPVETTREKRPEIPPHVLALQELDRIEAEKLWQQGREKEYHTRVTDVVRIFLEARFDVPAPEMTTDELLDRMRRKLSDARSLELLRSVLILADLVKFAKAHPVPDEHEQLIRESREIIQLNRPVTAADLSAKQEVQS